MFEAFSNLLLDKLKNDREREVTSSNDGGSKYDGGSFHKVPYKYSQDFIPGHSAPPIGKLPMLNEDNYDAWSDRMRSHLVSVHPSLWEIVNVGVYRPKDVGGPVVFTQGKQQANIKYLRNSPLGVPCSSLWETTNNQSYRNSLPEGKTKH